MFRRKLDIPGQLKTEKKKNPIEEEKEIVREAYQFQRELAREQIESLSVNSFTSLTTASIGYIPTGNIGTR